MQSLSEEGSPSSLENQRRPHIPPIKRKERKNDKGKDKLSRGKMSDLFGKAKDAGVDGDKVTASSAAKGAMEVEAVGDNNDGMQSPLPAPPAPSNLLSSSNDNGGLGGVTAGSPSGGNHQGAAAVADVLPGSASSSAQGKSNLETLMEGAMSATDVYVKFVDFIETVNPSPSRIQEWVELNKVDIKKQTAAAYHAIHSHSAIVFEERFFYRMWIGAYQWGVEQPIKDYTTVVILDERLKGHELWEGKEAFCRWFAVLLDNKFKSYENYHYKMAGASQLRANQAYPAYRVFV